MAQPYRVQFAPRLIVREEIRTRVGGPRDVAAFMTPYADIEPAEVFWVLMLDAQHRVIGNRPVEITRGLLNSSLVHPREVFRPAIMAGAAAIVVCHNHPSGDPKPSAEDRDVTATLVAAGQVIDIPVHDHVVMGAGCYVSLVEQGMM